MRTAPRYSYSKTLPSAGRWASGKQGWLGKAQSQKGYAVSTTDQSGLVTQSWLLFQPHHQHCPFKPWASTPAQPFLSGCWDVTGPPVLISLPKTVGFS